MWPAEAPSLTKQERAVARFAEDHPLLFATQSGSEIALATRTSEASVARTAQRLGFENVREMKAFCAARVQEAANLQSVLSGRLEALGAGAAGSDQDPSAVGSMPSALHAAAQLVLGVEDSVDWEVVETAAETLSEAPRVLFYGLGTAHCIAQYAEIEFARIGIEARAISGGGHANAHAAFQVRDGDAVLILAPRVMFPDIQRFATAALEVTSRVIVMTQASIPSDLRSRGVAPLRLPSSGGSGATDAVSTIALIDALVAEIARRAPERSLEARARAQTYRDRFSQ